MQTLEKKPMFHKALMQFGEDKTVTSHVLKDLEHVTCLMYRHNRLSSVDVVRAKLLHKKVGKTINTLPSLRPIWFASSLPHCFEAASLACEPPRRFDKPS